MTDGPRHGRSVNLNDLFSQLLWTKLLRAPAMGLRPDRIGVAFFSLVLIGVIASVSSLWIPERNDAGERVPQFPEGITEPAQQAYINLVEGVFDGRPDQVGNGISELMALPQQAIDLFPVSIFVLGLPMLAVWAIGTCAICRMVACEFSQGVEMPWTRAVGFSLNRAGSSIGGLLLPLGFVGVIVLGLAVAGWALLNLPVLNLLGGLGYFLFQIAGVLGVLLLIGYAIGKHLIVPSVACDGSDAIDAMQRAYAYVVDHPLRLLIYLAIGGMLTLVVAIVANLAITLGLNVTTTATESWLSEETRALLHPGGGDPPGGTWNAASALLSLWTSVFQLLLLAVIVSVYSSVTTVVYLLIRQVCDGQDHRELWMPGSLGGTQAPATGS